MASVKAILSGIAVLLMLGSVRGETFAEAVAREEAMVMQKVEAEAMEEAAAKTQEEILALKEILTLLDDPSSYDREIPPFNLSHPLPLGVQMYIRHLDVDDIDMQFLVDLTFRMLWTDPRLSYRNKEVNYVTVTDPSKVWLPDPFFKSSVWTKQHVTLHPESYLRVSANGSIIYSTRFSVKLYCNMDLSRFPHDLQMCPITVASYGYSKDDILFHYDQENPIQFARDLSPQRFSLIYHKTDTCDTTTARGTYSCLELDLFLRRAFFSYLIEWYVPVIMLVLVSWTSLLVPRPQLLARLLLCLAPFLILTMGTIHYYPSSSSLTQVPYTRAIDHFTGVSLAIIFATLVSVLSTSYISGRSSTGHPNSSSSSNGTAVAMPNADQVESQATAKDDGAAIELESHSGKHKLKTFLKKSQDSIIRLALVSVYTFYLVVYIAFYSQ